MSPRRRRGAGGRLSAAAGLLVAVAAISWAAILVRLAEAPSLAIAFYRLALTSLLLAPWGLRREALFRGGLAALLAGLCLGLHFATWIASLAYTSVASSVLLVSTQPLFTAWLAPRLLGERTGGEAWVGTLLAFAGVVGLSGADLSVGGRAWIGDALALAGAATAALYFVLGRRVRERVGLVPYLWFVNSVAAAGVLFVALAAGVPLAGFSGPTWGWLLLLALGPNLCGHGLLNWAVRRLRALPVNLAVLGEPVLATLYAAWLFGEIPSPMLLPAAVLLLIGVGLVARRSGLPAPAA